MDFYGKLLHPLPFYMTHPGYLGPDTEAAALRDLEYLQQTFPKEVRLYQRKIAEIMDKMDYEGSMIYDEYPDRYTLQRLSESIITILKQEEKNAGEESVDIDEKWSRRTDLIQVLLCNEIFKRRHGGRRAANFFRTFH